MTGSVVSDMAAAAAAAQARIGMALSWCRLPSDATFTQLAAALKQRGVHLSLGFGPGQEDFSCCLLNTAWRWLFWPLTIAHGATPFSATALALADLLDPESHPDIDSAIDRALSWRLMHHSELPETKHVRRYQRVTQHDEARRGRPAFSRAGGRIFALPARPAEAARGRTVDGWYPVGELRDTIAGERFRVWLQMLGERVHTQRLGPLGEATADDPCDVPATAPPLF